MAWRHSCILTCLYLYIFIYLRVLIYRYKHLFHSLPRLPTPAEIYVRRVWWSFKMVKVNMGLGTHLGRLGGGEFQHNPCSDERINIPMALDIATLEIHVIQRVRWEGWWVNWASFWWVVWFKHVFGNFSPSNLGKMNSFWRIFFQMGWNHHLGQFLFDVLFSFIWDTVGSDFMAPKRRCLFWVILQLHGMVRGHLAGRFFWNMHVNKDHVFGCWALASLLKSLDWVALGSVFHSRSQAELRKDVVTFSSAVTTSRPECQRRVIESRLQGHGRCWTGFPVRGLWEFLGCEARFVTHLALEGQPKHLHLASHSWPVATSVSQSIYPY